MESSRLQIAAKHAMSRVQGQQYASRALEKPSSIGLYKCGRVVRVKEQLKFRAVPGRAHEEGLMWGCLHHGRPKTLSSQLPSTRGTSTGNNHSIYCRLTSSGTLCRIESRSTLGSPKEVIHMAQLSESTPALSPDARVKRLHTSSNGI